MKRRVIHINEAIRLLELGDQALSANVVSDLYVEGLTAVCIPDSKAKPVMYYNYCGSKVKSIIIEAKEDLFRINLCAELDPSFFVV